MGIDATYLLTAERTGVETYALQLLWALLGLSGGSETFLYAAGGGPPPDAAGLFAGAGRSRLSPTPRLWLRARMPLLMALDRVKVAHFPGTLLPLWLPCPAVTTFYDLAVLHYPHLYDPRERGYYDHLIPAAAHRSAAVLAISESTARDVISAFDVDPAKVFVTPLGVAPRFRPIEDAPSRVAGRYGIENPYILAAVGSGHPRKNLVGVVEAFSALAQPDLSLVIVGAAQRDQAAVRAAEASPLKDRIHLLGYVPQEDLPMIYSAASVFCFPSLYEGFGLPVLESMACGTPVVCSNTSSLPEVAGDAAVLIDPSDPAQLPRAIGEVLRDGELSARLSAAGRRRAAGFTWERCARMTLEAYRYAAEAGARN